MTLVLIGTDYREVPLEDLDRLSQAREAIESSLVQNFSDSNVAGAVALSTCNRFELYLDCEDFATASKFAMKTIAEKSGLDPPIAARYSRRSATRPQPSTSFR